MHDVCSALGQRPSGARLARLARSPQYAEGRFRNPLPSLQAGAMLLALKKWLFGSLKHRVPTAPIPVVRRTAEDFAAPAPGLRVTWLGHASMLIEIEGQRFLTDPVWSDNASPGPLFGVKRFFDPPLALDDLPPLDAVVLSHDHYDHLDAATIRALAARVPRFIVPLGVGAHLESWGVPADRITELDWWERVAVGGVELVCTPARHFSGRTLTARDASLWSGWAFLGAHQRAYFSGDSAMFPGFEEIGARLGPFDLTMIEIGAYDPSWADVHMGPEQAVRAHRMVRGGVMMPVHWGTFNLAFHGWTEPAERLRVAAEQAGVPVVLPRPGESVEPATPPTLQPWWPEVPWASAQEAPIVSSGNSAP